MDPADLLSRYGDRITHVEHVPARERSSSRGPTGSSPPVRAVFEAERARELWAHQAEALQPRARRTARGHLHRHGVRQVAGVPGAGAEALAGGTHRAARCRATGRPPCCTSRRPRRSPPTSGDGWPGRRTLVRAATVDGDNSREERDWARNHAD